MNTQKNKGDILAERIEEMANECTDNGYLGLTRRLLGALAEYRKPWVLGRSVNGHKLADGQGWHRQDWAEDMLPEGWRPLIIGEEMECQSGDQYGDGYELTNDSEPKIWRSLIGLRKSLSHMRTRRPLPAVVEKWATEKQAFLDGKKIECRHAQYPQWADMTTNVWPMDWEFRVKPAPVMVPLGPEDVPPGSVFRHIGTIAGTWFNPIQVHPKGIDINFTDEGISWEELKQYEISRDGGKTWQKCEKPEGGK